MYVATKDGKEITLKNEIQAVAYEKSGWVISEGTAQPVPSELSALKEQADGLGIKYHWNIGAEKLKEIIAQHGTE